MAFVQENSFVLDVVHNASIFPDSKTFVDLYLRKPQEEVLEAFKNLISDTNEVPKEKVLELLEHYFEEIGEFEHWEPSDYNPEPAFLKKIKNERYKEFCKLLNGIWPSLSRKVKKEVFEDPEKSSLIAIPNGFIIPGGRFKEIYYWDSLWIIEGLLICDMTETVRGILENFIHMIDTLGFIPNGSRKYYTSRSQPPLFAFMVNEYIKATNNTEWLHKNIASIEKELQFWLNKFTCLKKGEKDYHMCRYISETPLPRPESYKEDMDTASKGDKEKCYIELRSSAESGWDFSSRWIFDSDEHELHKTEITRVIPVDLNAMLCRDFEIISELYSLIGESEKAILWMKKSKDLLEAIDELLYNEEEGIWLDYDVKTNSQRKRFYASNFSPLWTGSYDKNQSSRYGERAVEYLKKNGILELKGGVPCSLIRTEQQWDFPNVWPPLQSIVTLGLDRTGHPEAQKVARQLAETYLESNLQAFNETNVMFEKYDAESPGKYGYGGEYAVQPGFGWSNGVILSFVKHFQF